MTTRTSVIPRAGGFIISEADGHRSRDKIIVLAGQVLKAGHVLGKIMVGATAAGVAAAGNTGNGTMGALTLASSARTGTYQVIVIEPVANGGAFEVAAPDGAIVGTGNVGVAFTSEDLSFTVTDGSTDFVAGDRFSIAVSGGTEKYKEYNPANADGSDRPAVVLWDACDASVGDIGAVTMVRQCEVNPEELTWFSGATDGQKAAALAMLARSARILARAAAA